MSRAPVVLVLLVLGCAGPFGPFPGGALGGEVVTEPVDDWSFAEAFSFLALETRPADPYSANVGFVLVDGRIHLDPAPERTWGRNLREDPRARIELGGLVYPVRAVRVTDADVLAHFDPDRIVYRLESRAE